MMTPISTTQEVHALVSQTATSPTPGSWDTALIWVACRPWSSHRKSGNAGDFRMSVNVLEREMFTEAEAARLLGVAQRTLNYWLEGGSYRGVKYRPVIRVEPRGGRNAVTWAEFVEAGLLREYRQTHGVPMAELRSFIDQVRRDFGIPYPLADRRPYVSGRELLAEAQETTGLDAACASSPSLEASTSLPQPPTPSTGASRGRATRPPPGGRTTTRSLPFSCSRGCAPGARRSRASARKSCGRASRPGKPSATSPPTST